MKSFDNVDILFCDNHVVIVAKPAGMVTQGDGLEQKVKEWVKEKFQKKGEVFLHAVHRLDRCVSGLVLFAKTSKALSRLNEQSRRQEIQRVYIGEVEGVLPEKRGKLKHYLVHGEHKAIISDEKNPDAKLAVLTFEVIKHHAGSTLVQIELETGRYHQIRAQFSAIGHPIVFDKKYGSEKGDGNEIHLHAHKLSFKHPVTEEILKFTSSPSFM